MRLTGARQSCGGRSCSGLPPVSLPGTPWWQGHALRDVASCCGPRPQRAEYPDYLRPIGMPLPLAGQRHPPLHHPSYAAMGRSRLLHPVGLPPVLPAEPPARHGVRLGQHPRRHFYDAGPFRRAGRACHRRGYHERHLRRGQMLTRIIQRGARSGVTNTNIYANMRRMWTTSALPFALTCAGYLALASRPGALRQPDAGQMDRLPCQRLDALARRLYRRPEPVPRRRETGHVLEHPRGGRRLPDRTGHGARGTVRLPRLRLHPRARSGNTRRRRHPVHASGGGHRPAVVVLFGHFRRDRPPERFRRPHTASGGAHRDVPGRDAGKRPRVRHKLQPDARHHPDRAVVPPLLRPQAGHGDPPRKQRHPHSRADPVEHRRQPPLRHARRDDGLPPVCVVFVPCPAGERAAQRPRPRRARNPPPPSDGLR